MLSFKGYSTLRSFQILECENITLSGKCIEFGAVDGDKKNFSYYFKGEPKYFYSNIDKRNSKNYIQLDLTKKLKLKNRSFNNVIFLNVLEHLPNINIAFKELERVLKKNGHLIGSTPFIYQVHGAPNDYYRFSKDFFIKKFNKKKYKSVKIIPLGFGPFVASYSLIFPLFKILPIFKEIILSICFVMDSIVQIFVKTNLNEIYPVGYFFKIKK